MIYEERHRLIAVVLAGLDGKWPMPSTQRVAEIEVGTELDEYAILEAAIRYTSCYGDDYIASEGYIYMYNRKALTHFERHFCAFRSAATLEVQGARGEEVLRVGDAQSRWSF